MRFGVLAFNVFCWTVWNILFMVGGGWAFSIFHLQSSILCRGNRNGAVVPKHQRCVGVAERQRRQTRCR